MNASNPLASAYYEITFQMQRGVGPVSVWADSPLTKNTSVPLLVDPGWVGTDACYYIDFGYAYAPGEFWGLTEVYCVHHFQILFAFC